MNHFRRISYKPDYIMMFIPFPDQRSISIAQESSARSRTSNVVSTVSLTISLNSLFLITPGADQLYVGLAIITSLY